MKTPVPSAALQRMVIALGLAVATAVPALAQTSYTWNTGSGTWSTSTSWTPTAPTNGPSGSGTTAVFADTATNRSVSSTAALTLGGLSMTQTTANALNEVLFGGTTTISNAVTLGASSGTARLSFLGSTSAMTATFSNGITINAGGQLIAGINTASNYRTTAVNGPITISGGLFEVNGLYNGATSTNQNVTNTSGLTMTSGTLRFGAGMGQFGPSGNLTITGGTLVNDTGNTILSLSGTTNTINPALSSGSSYSALWLNRAGDQSITLGANAPSVNLLRLRQTGVRTVTVDPNTPAIGQLGLEQQTSGTSTLKLGSNFTITNGTVNAYNTSATQSVAIDVGTFTLTFNGSTSGNFTPTGFSATSPMNYTLFGAGGSIKARSFTLGSTNTTVNVGPGLVLEATGTANSLVNVLSGSGTIDPTSIFRYSGGASAANPATLVSDRAIGDVEVTSGALRITGLTTAQAVRITGGTLDLNNSNYLFTSAVVNGGTIASGTLTSTGLIDARAGSVSANLAGSVGLTKTAAGTLMLAGTNAYSGVTTINAGRLEVAATGGINSSSGVTINGGEFKYNSTTTLSAPITFTAGTLSGTGSIGTAVTVGASDILSPGNSPGSQAFTSGLTFASGGQYTWEINNWTGTAGTNYDQLVVSGSPLNITATSGSTFRIAVTGLTSGNVSGVVPNFLGSTGTSFTIATSSAGITGFDKSDFTLDTSAFTNNNTPPTNAGFWLSTSSTSLLLNYAPSATYNLSANANATAIRVGGTSTITATVTSSTASVTNPDQLAFAGLAVTNGGTLSATSGIVNPGALTSGSVAFTGTSAGSYTFTPSITSGSNVNIGTAAIPGSTSAATVTVWNPAVASVSGSVNLGTVIKGATLSQALSIANVAPNTGFSEKLDAIFGTLSGVSTNSGSISLLAAGGTNTLNMAVGFDTTAAGAKTGSAQILFTTNGDGTSGLGTLALAPQTVNLAGTVLDHATPGFVAAGIIDPWASGTLTLNFGSVDSAAGLQSQTFSITNLYDAIVGANFTAGLALTGTNLGTGPFSLSGPSFSTLVAGGTSNPFTVSFTPSSQGSFSQTFTLSFADNQSLAGAASRRDLSVVATVIVVPEPGAIALAGIGIAAAAWAVAKRQRGCRRCESDPRVSHRRIR